MHFAGPARPGLTMAHVRALSHWLSAFFLVPALAAGCYDAHERVPSPLGVPRPDAGVVRRPDAALPAVDASASPDAPSRCPLARADASCLSSFAIPAGVSFELPFQFDGCACCVDTTCDVSVDAAARTLRLGTHLCPDPCDCDACNTPTGVCEVPPLPLEALGEWTVEVNGQSAFVIGVIDAFDPVVAPPPGCATYAEADSCGAPVDFTMGPVRGDVCVEHAALADRDVLRLHSACWGCGDLDSACDAIVTPRLTDDLPPGGDITLHARRYGTSCDVDCPGVCIEHVRVCALPPLLPGGVYRVLVDGEVLRTFTEGEPSPPCVTF